MTRNINAEPVELFTHSIAYKEPNRKTKNVPERTIFSPDEIFTNKKIFSPIRISYIEI